jgi:hypothetical protein
MYYLAYVTLGKTLREGGRKKGEIKEKLRKKRKTEAR